jgi:hypothetical protein
MNLVRGDLFTLTAATHDDAELGLAADDRPGDRRAEARVVHSFFRVRTQIEHVVTTLFEVTGELALQTESGMVGAEGDLHALILVRAAALKAFSRSR